MPLCSPLGHIVFRLLHLGTLSAVHPYRSQKQMEKPPMKKTDHHEGLQAHPDQWKTGDEPLTTAQEHYLETLAREAGQDVDNDLTKAEASKKIDELREKTGRA
jgi:hypothetical protein